MSAIPTLGAQLHKLREATGLPGWKVGAAAGMDSAALSKIENGKRLPTKEQLAALAKYFQVPVGPLETLRIAEDVLRQYANDPAWPAVASMIAEAGREYRVSKSRKM